jgi:hypothetical protein
MASVLCARGILKGPRPLSRRRHNHSTPSPGTHHKLSKVSAYTVSSSRITVSYASLTQRTSCGGPYSLPQKPFFAHLKTRELSGVTTAPLNGIRPVRSWDSQGPAALEPSETQPLHSPTRQRTLCPLLPLAPPLLLPNRARVSSEPSHLLLPAQGPLCHRKSPDRERSGLGCISA